MTMLLSSLSSSSAAAATTAAAAVNRDFYEVKTYGEKNMFG